MVSLEKWMIFTPLQKLPKNGEDWGKLIVAKGFKKLPKVQNIAQSGHTGHTCQTQLVCINLQFHRIVHFMNWSHIAQSTFAMVFFWSREWRLGHTFPTFS